MVALILGRRRGRTEEKSWVEEEPVTDARVPAGSRLRPKVVAGRPDCRVPVGRAQAIFASESSLSVTGPAGPEQLGRT
ncbi:hypothetical protein ABTE74_22490, partial [Acinetobacter baumannii]